MYLDDVVQLYLFEDINGVVWGSRDGEGLSTICLYGYSYFGCSILLGFLLSVLLSAQLVQAPFVSLQLSNQKSSPLDCYSANTAQMVNNCHLNKLVELSIYK